MCSSTVRGESSHEFQSRSGYKWELLKTFFFSPIFSIKMHSTSGILHTLTSLRCFVELWLPSFWTTLILFKISHSELERLRRREKQHKALRISAKIPRRNDLSRLKTWTTNIFQRSEDKKKKKIVLMCADVSCHITIHIQLTLTHRGNDVTLCSIRYRIFWHLFVVNLYSVLTSSKQRWRMQCAYRVLMVN